MKKKSRRKQPRVDAAALRSIEAALQQWAQQILVRALVRHSDRPDLVTFDMDELVPALVLSHLTRDGSVRKAIRSAVTHGSETAPLLLTPPGGIELLAKRLEQWFREDEKKYGESLEFLCAEAPTNPLVAAWRTIETATKAPITAEDDSTFELLYAIKKACFIYVGSVEPEWTKVLRDVGVCELDTE